MYKVRSYPVFDGSVAVILCIFKFFVLLVSVHHVCSRRCCPLDLALLITPWNLGLWLLFFNKGSLEYYFHTFFHILNSHDSRDIHVQNVIMSLDLNWYCYWVHLVIYLSYHEWHNLLAASTAAWLLDTIPMQKI